MSASVYIFVLQLYYFFSHHGGSHTGFAQVPDAFDLDGDYTIQEGKGSEYTQNDVEFADVEARHLGGFRRRRSFKGGRAERWEERGREVERGAESERGRKRRDRERVCVWGTRRLIAFQAIFDLIFRVPSFSSFYLILLHTSLDLQGKPEPNLVKYFGRANKKSAKVDEKSKRNVVLWPHGGEQLDIRFLDTRKTLRDFFSPSSYDVQEYASEAFPVLDRGRGVVDRSLLPRRQEKSCHYIRLSISYATPPSSGGISGGAREPAKLG